MKWDTDLCLSYVGQEEPLSSVMNVHFFHWGLCLCLVPSLPSAAWSVASVPLLSVLLAHLLSRGHCPTSGLVIFSLGDFSSTLPVSGIWPFHTTPPCCRWANWQLPLSHPPWLSSITESCTCCLSPAFQPWSSLLSMMNPAPETLNRNVFPSALHAFCLWVFAMQSPLIWKPVWHSRHRRWCFLAGRSFFGVLYFIL